MVLTPDSNLGNKGKENARTSEAVKEVNGMMELFTQLSFNLSTLQSSWSLERVLGTSLTLALLAWDYFSFNMENFVSWELVLFQANQESRSPYL